MQRGFRLTWLNDQKQWWLGYGLLFIIVCGACRSAPPAPAREQLPVKASASATMRHDIGFASRQKLVEHYEKHGRAFGAIPQLEYLRQAQGLRDRPAGGAVLEVIRADGVITRFDRRMGAFLAFDPDLTIRTFFKPNDGEAYFWRQSKRPAR